MEEDKTEAELKTPLGTASIRTKRLLDVLAAISFTVVLLLSYIIWEHKVEQRDFNKLFIGAINSLVMATKMQTCINTLPMEKREIEYNNPMSFCARMSETKLHDIK